MKFFVPLFLAFVFTTFSNCSLYSQSITSRDTIQKRSTDIIKKVLTNNNVSYRFVSNRLLVPERIQAWENRFIITYNELIKIEFDIDSQTVYIVLSENYQLETLDSILGRFGVNNYTVKIK